MIRFILNDTLVESTAPEGTVMLDILRYHEQLKGTKIGCREGDCGACTVLVGELKNDQVEYRSMTSCLLALANVKGKHIVTVEGLNMERLSPVQQAMVDESGTQCGFCTPGFVVSLSGCCLSHERVTDELAVRAIDGNICRCTGYKSIERAAAIVAGHLAKKDVADPVKWSVGNSFVPPYFAGIAERLKGIEQTSRKPGPVPDGTIALGGGTDLYVQKHDSMHHARIHNLFDEKGIKNITLARDHNGVAICSIGAGVVASDLLASQDLMKRLPGLEKHLLLVSSTPIRNMGTVAGNLVNASPIGDLSAMLLALNAKVDLLGKGGRMRSPMLKDFFLGYKQIDKRPEEEVTAVRFVLPDANTRFHFEKVSKRTHLDIASVNTAIRLEMDGHTIREAHVSAGGVAPTPKYLSNTVAFLTGKSVDQKTIREAIGVMNDEIAPISDARGTADYKRLLLRQLFFAHFMQLFPERFTLKELVA
ncbi:MAG: FAD binding domain-containing protein [Flavobacteriales bacterium]|nr:FAD binding domain-containing protein [Flavobacteriales bacterium]